MMGNWNNRFITLVGGFLFMALGLYMLNFVAKQSEFQFIILGYSLAFGGYALLIKSKMDQKYLISLAVSLPLICLFTLPTLSDDIYRFLWDGVILHNGYNPFLHLPSHLTDFHKIKLNAHLYEMMNSRNYYTVYPSILQVIFFISTTVGHAILGYTLTMKGIYYGIHIIGFYYCQKINLNSNFKIATSIYYLNPLVINEGIGNLHPEIVMVSFVVMAFYFYSISTLKSALFLSFAVAVKILPLLLIPYLFFKMPKPKFRKFITYLFFFCFILFLPIFIGLQNFGSSIDLYFRKFEFNGSFYYLLRFLGYQISGYNLIAYIGPLLGFISTGTIIYIGYNSNKLGLKEIGAVAFISFTVFFLCSSIVHPWYLISIVFFGMLGHIRSILFWSYLATFSYYSYNGGYFQEHFFIVMSEYLLFFIAFFYLDKKSISIFIKTD